MVRKMRAGKVPPRIPINERGATNDVDTARRVVSATWSGQTGPGRGCQCQVKQQKRGGVTDERMGYEEGQGWHTVGADDTVDTRGATWKTVGHLHDSGHSRRR